MDETKNDNRWKANWISYPYEHFDMSKAVPAPFFRKSFSLSERVKQAYIRICGLGFFELHVNGKRVGDEVLNPPFTKYDTTVLYSTFDVKDMLVTGENTIGVILGNGRYNIFSKNAWDYEKAPWRHHPKFILELHIITENDENLLIKSDSSWKASFGPIISDSLYGGEVYDARLEMPGWDRPGFDDSRWRQASICRGPGGILKPMELEPCRVIKRIKPKAFWEIRSGVWVYDMGINMSGWAALKVKGDRGTAVTMRFAEKLTSEGDIDQSNINMFADPDEFQKDIYILKGEGEEVWEPRFTYHGFQFIQLSGYPGTPDENSIEGCMVYTDLKDRGSFECSNELLNKIQKAARLSTLGNYHGIPTDCPHREKNGWTGDAVLSAEQVLLNFEPSKAYRKFLQDMIDCQRPDGQLPGIVPTGGWGYNWGSGPAWDCAIVMIPWYIYLYRGDRSILLEMYEYMKKYVDFMSSMSDEYIVDFGLGDWNPPKGGPTGHKCPSKVTDTAIYYMNCKILADTAKILGYEEDAIYYNEKKNNIFNAFNREFVNSETGEVTGNCQTSYACALYFGLVEGEVRQKVISNLVKEIERCKYHIDCGILGSKYILQVLTDIERADLAYAIASQRTFPGWGYWIEHGATTLWETWNGDSSRNHHMFSDISAWFYKCLAGINPDPEEPGFRHIIIKPHPVDGLEWVKACHESCYGMIECSWNKAGKEKLTLRVRVPENSYATVYVPGVCKRATDENGKPLSADGKLNVECEKRKYTVYEVKPGTYEFESEIMQAAKC